MKYAEKLALATRLLVFSLAVFAVMQLLAIATGGQAAQEAFEVFADPADYSARMRAASGTLRIILFADLFFIIGFGAAIGMLSWAHAGRNRAAAWVTGLGIVLVMALDLAEDITLILSLDIVASGADLTLERIVAQVQISSAKWMVSAIALVALTFILPNHTALERLLVSATRLFLPLGISLFVTGAFDAKLIGGLIILGGIFGGLALLALTTRLQAREAATLTKPT